MFGNPANVVVEDLGARGRAARGVYVQQQRPETFAPGYRVKKPGVGGNANPTAYRAMDFHHGYAGALSE